MHSLPNPSRVGCIQLYRELGRCECSVSFLLNPEGDEIGWLTQLPGRQVVPSVVSRPGRCILIKRGGKLRRQQMSLFWRQVKKRERQVKRLELKKPSSSFSPLPNRKKISKHVLKCWDFTHGAGDCELTCCVVDADSNPCEHPGFSLVKL